MAQPMLSVVLPTRHEADTIGSFLQRLLSAIDGIPAEVIVVDDSDHDDTLVVLLRAQQRIGDRLVVHHRPRGSVPERSLGTAVVDGIGLARAEYVCVMDADGQHPPEVIPAMLAAARAEGADYVGGSRYLPGGSAEGLNGTLRKAISLALALTTRLTFLLTSIRGMTDPLSGFFLFRREIVDGVQLKPIGWKISLEVMARGRAQRLTEVPYQFAQREGGDSKATVREGLLLLQHILVLVVSRTGVRRFFTFGLVGASGIGVNTGSLLLLHRLGFDPLGWPIWASTELSILWNYNLNRHVTWADRDYGHWWAYNLAAGISSLLAIGVTIAAVRWEHAPMWLGSLTGIAVGMVLNFLLFDNVVFKALPGISMRMGPVLKRAIHLRHAAVTETEPAAAPNGVQGT